MQAMPVYPTVAPGNAKDGYVKETMCDKKPGLVIVTPHSFGVLSLILAIPIVSQIIQYVEHNNKCMVHDVCDHKRELIVSCLVAISGAVFLYLCKLSIMCM